MEEKERGFPTFQDSYFCDTGEQIVIRGNDFKKFKEDVALVKELFPIKQSENPPPQSLGNCSHCGAVNAMSKKGKIYCSRRCWLKNEKSY